MSLSFTKSLLLSVPFLLVLGCTQPAPEPESTPGAMSTPPPMPAGPGRTVKIQVQDYKFIPNEIFASRGEKLHFVVENSGQEHHGMVFDFPQGATRMPSEVYGGQSTEFDIVAPNQAGKYYFHCPVGNHYARGMLGDIVVR